MSISRSVRLRVLWMTLLTLNLGSICVVAQDADKPKQPTAAATVISNEAKTRLQRLDADQDGRISRAEFPGQPPAFRRLDSNNDEFLDPAEIEAGLTARPREEAGRPRDRRMGDSNARGRNTGRQSMEERVQSQGVKVGDNVPNGQVLDLQGETLELESLWKDKPLLLVTGSITCPIAVDTCPSLQPLLKEHDRRIYIAILYVREAHPSELNPATFPAKTENEPAIGFGSQPQPNSQEQRQALAKIFHKRFGDPVPVYVAELNNTLPNRLGTGPNSALLINTTGKLLVKQGWYDAEKMEVEIEKLLAETIPAP
jgi:hypothetical protein